MIPKFERHTFLESHQIRGVDMYGYKRYSVFFEKLLIQNLAYVRNYPQMAKEIYSGEWVTLQK